MEIASPGPLVTNEDNVRLPVDNTTTFTYKQGSATSSDPLRKAMSPITQATLAVPPIRFWPVSGPFTEQSGPPHQSAASQMDVRTPRPDI